MVWNIPNGVVKHFLNHNSQVADVANQINSFRKEFKPKSYLEVAFAKKDEIINSIKNKYITDLIEPLQDQIKEIRDQKENKEKELQTAKNRREELESIKTIISTQISNFSDLKTSIL